MAVLLLLLSTSRPSPKVPWRASRPARTPGTGSEPALEPGVDGLVPGADVGWAQDPVVLVGEVEQARRHRETLQCGEQLERLGHRDPVVLLAMDDQHGCLD